MPLIDSATGNVTREYSIEQLREAANLMRGYDLVTLCAAGSGHAGGTLSIMDITAALYLHVARHDPANPAWAERDRIVWSAGHKAPSLYLGLAFAGFCALDDVVTLRKLGSPFQGHPHWLKLPGVEVSTGSLGQGLSIAVGMALAARLDGKTHKVFCLMGDGEQQEGQVWEAAMEAGHYKLDNIVAVIDCNRLQIDGWVKDVMQVEPLAEKYASFGWNVMRVDGHDMQALVGAFAEAHAAEGKPVVILADTVKGKGVSFMENQAGWHGKTPNRVELDAALRELGLEGKIPVERLLERAKDFQAEAERKLEAAMPQFSRDYWWNGGASMKVAMEPTRKGLGQALAANGGMNAWCAWGWTSPARSRSAIFTRANRNARRDGSAWGLRNNRRPRRRQDWRGKASCRWSGSYATFSAARNLDQIRVSVCYSNLSVLIVGAHAGVSVGPDGATHQALEDLFAMMGLPNMSVVVPCDVVEARKATSYLLLQHQGPKYIRFAREATPIVSNEATPFVFGKANRIRLRHQAANFGEAFETRLDEDCRDEGEDLSIIACGPEVPEAMRAAWILRNEYGYTARILNMHTLKPIDTEAIVRAALETGAIVTAEEHQIGALAGRVSSVMTESPRLYGHACDHRGHRREGSLWRIRSAVGAGEGAGSERRAHRDEGGGADGAQA